MKNIIRIVSVALVVLMIAATLVSCGAPNSNPDKALEALKKNDYVAAQDKLVIPVALKAVGVDGIDSVISGTKASEDKIDTVTVIYFKDTSAANDAWNKVKEYAEKDKDSKSDWTIKKSGNMIYYGTSAAIKAAQ